ncbi:MAG TPA: hypothetical protein PLX84_13460 [Acidiphilium sp.]|nr:hypothetical protein [Acidiphilium sp.]
MTAGELIEAARRAGVTLRARVWAENPDQLQPEIRSAIRADEADILRELVHPRILILCAACGSAREIVAIENPGGWLCDGCAPDWQYVADERAAIVTEGADLLRDRRAA